MTKFPEIGNQTILFNSATPDGTDWTESGGTYALDQNKSAKIIYFKLTGLPVGRKIKEIRVLGALGATTANATTSDVDLRKVTKGAGAVTDASIDTATQVSVVADTALDQAISSLNEEITTDYQYYAKVTCTTADNAACDVALTGVEVDIN